MTFQVDFEYLKERYPFGDDDLQLLVTTFDMVYSERESLLTALATSFVENEKTILLDIFQLILPSDFEANLWETLMKSPVYTAKDDHKDEKNEKFECFLQGLTRCLGKNGPKECARILFSCCSQNDDNYTSPQDILDLVYRVAVAIKIITRSERNDNDLLTLSSTETPSFFDVHRPFINNMENFQEGNPNNKIIGESDFLKWIDNVASNLPFALATFFQCLIFSRSLENPQTFLFSLPKIYEESVFFSNTNSPFLFPFSCISPVFGGKWKRLYSFDDDGQEFNCMKHALLGYNGPTLIIIGTKQGVFGAFTNALWKESVDYFGDYDSFLFQLTPEFNVYNPTFQDNKFAYLSSMSKLRGKGGFANGLGFGGDKCSPRLFISASLEGCRASSFDKTFSAGNLIDPDQLENFTIGSMEIWAVGGDDTIRQGLGKRSEYRDLNNAHIQRTRVIKDKRAFLGDLEMYDSKIFAHQKEVRGRNEFSVDDVHGGYNLND